MTAASVGAPHGPLPAAPGRDPGWSVYGGSVGGAVGPLAVGLGTGVVRLP